MEPLREIIEDINPEKIDQRKLEQLVLIEEHLRSIKVILQFFCLLMIFSAAYKLFWPLINN